MSHKHAKVIREIFKEPVTGNLHWRDVESLLQHVGADVVQHGARLHVTLNGREGVIHRPHKSGSSSKQEVRHLREVLASLGVTPASYGE